MRYGKILHSHFGEYEEAIECYRRVIAADESQYKAQYQMGLIYAEQKNYKEAHSAFKKGLHTNKNYGPGNETNISWFNFINLTKYEYSVERSCPNVL